MSDPLMQFVTEVVTDAVKLGEYLRNPDAVLDRYGISREDREVIKRGGPDVLARRLTLAARAGVLPGHAASVAIYIVPSACGCPHCRAAAGEGEPG